MAEAFAVAGNAPVKAAVLSGVLPVRSAAVVVAEADRLRPLLAQGAEPAVLEGLVSMAVRHGARGCRMVRPGLLARYGLDGQLQGEQDVAKRFVALSQPRVDELGLAEYRLTVDVEGGRCWRRRWVRCRRPGRLRGSGTCARATGAAARRSSLWSGARSQRGTGRRRTRRARCSSRSTCETLRSGLRGAGVTVGGSDAGALLAPETVRRLACDAAIIPAVLGSEGEVLDLGRQVRLFTGSQVRRLWLRDGCCSFPGCDMPAQWADAHHLVHWADGGGTGVDNGALLCERHHTIVHTRRLAGRVVHDGRGSHVEWDLSRGSYDQLLAVRAAREPA